jgi:hypothetical protein
MTLARNFHNSTKLEPVKHLLRSSTKTVNLAPIGFSPYLRRTLSKGSATVTWRRDGEFSLPSVSWHLAKPLLSARQKVLDKEVVANV